MPETVRFGRRTVRVLGSKWVSSVISGFQNAQDSAEREVTLDISNVDFITLFDWLSVTTLLERALSKAVAPSIRIDVLGTSKAEVIPYDDFLAINRREKVTLGYTKTDYDVSERAYQILGFLEALGTRDVLNSRAGKSGGIFYPGIKASSAGRSNAFTEQGKHTVIHGLTRVENKDDCRQFLDEHRILSWRNAMERRFVNSPLFESEEIWRVLCHELAVNILEHAQTAGFIAARVVEAPIIEERVRPWCRAAYGEILGPLLKSIKQGFLELCVVDAGQGFIETLRPTYVKRTGVPESNIRSADVLAFAFDEVGTCKESSESWASDRHALGRILQIVAKYGGALRLRSADAEIIYRTKGGAFKRIPNHMGYAPQGTPPVTTYFPGAHLQIILPLTPFTDPDELREPRSVLSVSLPDTFLTQPDQVRGHLVPLREELGFSDAGIGREDQAKFRKACEKLSRKLLKRSMTEPLVLDFSDLNWTPAQFETLLYLLQNVLQHRPTLLVEIDTQLAREVDELERQSAKTLLDVAHISSSAGATGESFGEISERLFLETFSRVHAPVLGLDQNGRRFLFGVLEQEYKEPLLSLIDREASIEELCLETYRGTHLKESTLRSILNRVNCLFELAPQISDRQLWRSVWDAQTLANEASRAMTRHFDEVVKRSKAWRGMEGEADGE